MSISYQDVYGQVLDTGVAVQPATRANTEIESHIGVIVDTGSNLTAAQLLANHVPHRPAASPR